MLANYTHVESEIEYILTSVNGVTDRNDHQRSRGPLAELRERHAVLRQRHLQHPHHGSYRDKYIRGIPASAGSDVRGNKANMFVDASASWNVNDNLSLIFEAQNLTDERNTLYIDSLREDTLFQTEIGRTFTLGATYKF